MSAEELKDVVDNLFAAQMAVNIAFAAKSALSGNNEPDGNWCHLIEAVRSNRTKAHAQLHMACLHDAFKSSPEEKENKALAADKAYNKALEDQHKVLEGPDPSQILVLEAHARTHAALLHKIIAQSVKDRVEPERKRKEVTPSLDAKGTLLKWLRRRS